MYKKLFEFIFFVTLITAMVMSLNLAIADSTAMDLSTIQLFKYTLLVVLIASVLVRFPKALLAVAAASLVAGIYAYTKQLFMPADLVEYFREFFAWLPQFIIGYESFKLKYSLLFAIVYILLSTLIITLVVFNKRGYGLLIALGTGAFAFFWFIYVQKARQYMFYYLFAALILYSYNIYERKKKEWVNADSKIDKYIEFKWIFNSFIIVAVSIMISQFAVLDIKPVQWSWLSEKTLQAFPFIENWRNDNFDSYSFGFGSKYGIEAAGYKTAKLGGPVKLSDRTMLVVETDIMNNIYLRGTVKDIYNGNRWSKSRKSNIQYNSASALPMPWIENKAYSKEIKLTHQSMITSTIFAPNALSTVQHKSDRFFVDEDNEANFPRALGKQDSYTVKVEFPYIDLDQLRKQKAGIALETYSQLPDNISKRVRKLATDITAGYDNDYDKAKAIERFLRNSFKYTLTPSEVPESSEFVDYFLFEGKEGYCTYFATSMAVLLRAADIPCRYVEGFLAKYDGSFIRNVPGTDAHAWVEVNFGPYGWVTFEPTPAYPLLGYREQKNTPTAPISEPQANNSNTPAAPSEATTRDRNLQLEEEETASPSQQKKEISIGMRIFLTLFAILLMRVIYILLKRAYIELRLKKAIDKKYSVLYFQDLLRYFGKINLKMNKNETMREFWHQVKYTMEDSNQQGDIIIQLLERARYGSGRITADERRQLEEYRKTVKNFVTARLGGIKAFISYYIIGF